MQYEDSTPIQKNEERIQHSNVAQMPFFGDCTAKQLNMTLPMPLQDCTNTILSKFNEQPRQVKTPKRTPANKEDIINLNKTQKFFIN
jgi:hypothetical protein